PATVEGTVPSAGWSMQPRQRSGGGALGLGEAVDQPCTAVGLDRRPARAKAILDLGGEGLATGDEGRLGEGSGRPGVDHLPQPRGRPGGPPAPRRRRPPRRAVVPRRASSTPPPPDRGPVATGSRNRRPGGAGGSSARPKAKRTRLGPLRLARSAPAAAARHRP